MAAGTVFVVGSINVDLVVTLERLPRPGETVAGGSFARHGGGKGANQAVAAVRAGARVRFVGAVGDDEFGASAVAELDADGVDIDEIVRLQEPTGVALIAVDAEGRNQIAVASGANAGLDAALVDAALADDPLAAGDVCLLTFEIPDAAVLAAARAADDAGARVVLNPAPARELPAALPAGTILTPNALEAETLTGECDPDRAARALQARTSAPVLLTLGADGALLVDGDAATALPAPRVAVVDTTGASDVLAGVLGAGLAAGRTVADAARDAVQAASDSVRRAGARG
ncbi:MAG TPA: ribokinase [Solirubrobacteraceae bacterium]|nr:ribokinase [Solirubrobacteraceae bacterium]